jgi:hypothetical protein
MSNTHTRSIHNITIQDQSIDSIQPIKSTLRRGPGSSSGSLLGGLARSLTRRLVRGPMRALTRWNDTRRHRPVSLTQPHRDTHLRCSSAFGDTQRTSRTVPPSCRTGHTARSAALSGGRAPAPRQTAPRCRLRLHLFLRPCCEMLQRRPWRATQHTPSCVRASAHAGILNTHTTRHIRQPPSHTHTHAPASQYCAV